MKRATKVQLWVLFFALVGARLYIKPWMVAHVQNESDPCVQGDARLFYHFLPGCTEKTTRAGREYHVSYNKLGLRDHDYSPEPPKGKLRVLLVGPSILVAPGLDDDHLPARIAEAHLREKGIDAEIINASVMGYTPVQASLLLQSYLDAYHPGLVIYFLTVEASAANVMLKQNYWNRGTLEAGGSYFPNAATRFSPAVSGWLYRTGAHRWATTAEIFWRRLVTSWKFVFSSTEKAAEDSLGPTLEALKIMQSTCAARKIPFLVTFQKGEEYRNAYNLTRDIVPVFGHVYDFFTPRNILPTNDVRAYFTSHGMPLQEITMLSSPSIDGVEKFRLPGDIHLNELGASTLGGDLAALIERERGSLPAAPPAGKGRRH